MDKKIVLLGLMMLMTLLSFQRITAFEFDNRMSYDSKIGNYGEIKITNAFGLGSDIAKYQITYNTNKCLDKCSTGGTATIYQEMPLFTDAKFYNRINNEVKIVNYKFQIEKEKTVEYDEPIMKEVCKVLVNLSTSCHYEENGMKKISYKDYYYEDYDGKPLKAGTYKWRMEIIKGFDDKIDFVPEINYNGIGDFKFSQWIWYDNDYQHCRNIPFVFNSSPNMRVNEPVSVNVSLNSSDTAYFWMLFTGANNTDYSVYYNSLKDMRIVNASCNNGGSSQLIEIITNSSEMSYGARLFIWYDNDLNKTNLDQGATGGWTLTTQSIYSNVKYHTPPLSHYFLTNDAQPSYSLNKSYQNVYVVYVYYEQGFSITGDEYNVMIYNNDTIAENYLMTGVRPAGPTVYNSYSKDTISNDYAVRPTIYNGSWISFKTYIDTTGAYVWTNNNSYTSVHGVKGIKSIAGLTGIGSKNMYIDDLMVSYYNISLYDNRTYYSIEGEQDIPTGLVVTSSKPALNEKFNTSNVVFNCTGLSGASSLDAVLDLNLFIDGVLNYTIYNTSEKQNLSMQITRGITDGSHAYFCNGSDQGGLLSGSTSKAFSIDTVHPSPIIIYPLNTTYYDTNVIFMNTKTIDVNWTLTEPNPDKCIVQVNGVNYTATCSDNSTKVNITYGNNFIRFYVNDTYENFNSTTRGFTYLYRLRENGYNYTYQATEGYTDIYTYNFSLGTGETFGSGYLVYNGTSYLSSQSTDGTNYILTNTLSIPIVTKNELKNLYWSINLISSQVNSSTKNQNISNIQIDNCSLGGITILNITLVDELTWEPLNMTDGDFNTSTTDLDLSLSSWGTTNKVVNYSTRYTATNPVTVCLFTNLSGKYRLDLVVKEFANYSLEFFLITNGTLRTDNNVLDYYANKSITMSILTPTKSTPFLFKFKDEKGQIRDGSIVHVFQKFIENGTYNEVARAKQDDTGESILYLQEENTYYIFSMTENSQLIYTSSENIIKCIDSLCTLLFVATTSEINWTDYLDDLGTYTLVANGTTRLVTLSFVGNKSKTVNLSIYETDRDGTFTRINTSSYTGSGGAVQVYIPTSYGKKIYTAYIFEDGRLVKDMLVDFSDDAITYFGTFGAILSGFIIMTLVLMSISEGIILVFTVIFAIILMTIMTLVEISWLALISLICVVGIILFKINQRRRGV